MKKLIGLFLIVGYITLVVGCGNADNVNFAVDGNAAIVDMSSQSSESEQIETIITRNELGSMSPEEALAYMKETEDLVIVDVATTNHFDEMHFEGAINIPIEELDSEEENVLYMEIPADRPVILHCRLGMIVPGAYNRIKELRPDIPEISYIDGKPLFEEYNEWLENEAVTENIGTEVQKMSGGIKPEEALEYMKNTPDLVVVEVNAPEWKLAAGFEGAMYIPYTEMAERYNEIPEGRPVLLHCGGGIVSVEAYEILQEKRPDIPELSYIAGVPLVRAYNEWLGEQ